MTVRELRDVFDLSEVSIRRDLDYLARQGLIRRVRGGASANPRTASANLIERRLLYNTAAKRAIAREAVTLIGSGETVLLDSGTTVLEVARALPSILSDETTLTVVTRSLMIALELRSARNIRLIVLGGLYANDFDTFAGVQVERALEGIHVDRLLIGADGVDPKRGLTTDNLVEVPLFRHMAQAASQIVVTADSSKVGGGGLQSILSFDEIDVFVTDIGFPEAARATMRSAGVDVVLTPSS
jgi:DeoR/GlpR family transcriptional regulator of sugar metabolism